MNALSLQNYGVYFADGLRKELTLNAPIATKFVCFPRLLKCEEASLANSVDPVQTATLFASLLNLSVMLGNYLQQTTSGDDIFRCIFYLAL